jgi:cytidylate kinase|tara:strand:+ start:414 stop:1094 length:681 start_codon:yes stop_codon:yes gene_type:complete
MIEQNAPYVVVIDGPSGSGKGSLALRIAQNLDFNLLDSGAIYRLAALKALQKEVDINDELSVFESIVDLTIRFEIGQELSIPFLDGINMSNQIRQEATSEAASVIAQYPSVRQRLLTLQQDCFQPPGLVADGRDLGTVVFPKAKFKFFLLASVEIRAQRRHKQLIAMGISSNINTLQAEMTERDERDRNRSESPLVPAPDAIVVDSSMLDLEEVINLVSAHIKEST